MKMIVFDEVHNYMTKHGSATRSILRIIRQMRHQRAWIVVCSQDPESIHPTVFKLASILVAHQLKSRKSLKVLQDNIGACIETTIEELMSREIGEGWITTTDCADPRLKVKLQEVKLRPTCCKPTGTSETAVREG